MTLSNANEDVTMSVFVTVKSVQCKYFDEVFDVWETSGCSVVNWTQRTTVCRCDRVAQFGVSEMPFAGDLSFRHLPVFYAITFSFSVKLHLRDGRTDERTNERTNRRRE